MSGVKPITSYFPVLNKDQLEIAELLNTQSSRNYRTLSLQTASTNSTLSSKVYDAYVDLTKADDLPASVDVIAIDDDDDDDDDEEEEEEPAVVVGLGDSIFSVIIGRVIIKRCSYFTTFGVLPLIIDQGYDKIRRYTSKKCVVYQQQICLFMVHVCLDVLTVECVLLKYDQILTHCSL